MASGRSKGALSTDSTTVRTTTGSTTAAAPSLGTDGKTGVQPLTVTSSAGGAYVATVTIAGRITRIAFTPPASGAPTGTFTAYFTAETGSRWPATGTYTVGYTATNEIDIPPNMIVYGGLTITLAGMGNATKMLIEIAVTEDLSGDAFDTAASKVLAQSNPSAATLTTLYTVPANKTAIAAALLVCNRSVATSFRVAISPLGAAISNEHYIYYDLPIAANDTFLLENSIFLAATDVVRVYATLATLSFNLIGREVG